MQFIDTLKALPVQRQLMLAGAVLGVVLAMTMLVRGAMQSPMALLYSGLDPSHAGEVIQELEQRGVDYDIRGESIFIPESQRDAVRFSLAQQGLPKQSVQGYELLDEVNGFSVTSEMYNATYWRAKEGELTRTLLAIPGIDSARVHIGANLRSGFSRSQPAQTASVTLAAARQIDPAQAEAIQYLVALAVPGMAPEEVAVIDAQRGILAGPGTDDTNSPAATAGTQAETIEQKIMRLLTARVGPGNAQVSVSVDVSRERQRTSAVTYDPRSRVIRSRTINDVTENSQGTQPGMTVASNLPQGEAEGGATNTSNVRNSSESVSYEMNETRTETETLPGQVERVSVAVLLNETALGLVPGAADAEVQAREIASEFEELIRSGAGLDMARGDTLTVELMPFQDRPVEDMVSAPGLFEQLMQRYFWSALQVLLLGLVVIALGLGVIRPMLTQRPPEEAGRAVQGAIAGAPGMLADQTNEQPTDPFEYLRDYARDRQEETAALLQEWLNEDRNVAANE